MKKFIKIPLFFILMSVIGIQSHAYEYKYGTYSKKTLQKALAGDAEAQNTIGDGYFVGNGVQQDYKKALEWYLKAANNGNLEAMNSVALMYYDEDYGLPLDTKKALHWYKLAADQGHALSQYMLSCIYRDDEQYKNPKLFYEYAIKAADSGLDIALVDLASYYADSSYGFPYDVKLAEKYYKLALDANPNNAIALTGLGILYTTDSNVLDYKKGIPLLEKAMNVGESTLAAYNLGIIYFYGDGIAKNYKKAAYYFEYAYENAMNIYLIDESRKKLIEIYEQGGYGINKNLKKVKKLELYEIGQ